MINLTNYILLSETILCSIRDLKDTLVLHDGEKYYIAFDVLKQCMEKANNIKTCAKVLSVLMYIISEGQNELEVLNKDGYIITTIHWDNETQYYKQRDTLTI